MQTLEPAQFAEIAYRQPLGDVYAGIETIAERPAGPWARAEGGPILLGFEEACVLLKQPLGRRHVEMCLTSVDQWSAVAKEAYPAVLVGVMQIFGTGQNVQDRAERRDRVSQVTLFQEQETENIAGMILDLAAGTSFGVDASSGSGLVWFLDGQAEVFRREYVEVQSLRERVLPTP